MLKYDSNGVLEVTPDFSRLSYRIDTGDRVAYEYWVEHVSPGMRFDAALNEAKMMNDVFARIAHQRQTEIVGDEFDLAPKRSFRMLVNAEIVSGVDFECDGVFVHYFVELPPGWTPATTSAFNFLKKKSIPSPSLSFKNNFIQVLFSIPSSKIF